VTLTGMIETQTDAESVPILVRRVPGVVSVVSKLGWLDQNGRLDGKPVEPSGGAPAPSDRLPTFLQEHRRAILTAAGNALARQHMPHYSWDGDETALRRLSALFEQLLCALDSHDLGPIVAYAERVAEERFSQPDTTCPRSKSPSTPSKRRPGRAYSPSSTRRDSLRRSA
jgi:hypothetical protein